MTSHGVIVREADDPVITNVSIKNMRLRLLDAGLRAGEEFDRHFA
jgi:hypothetical protein